MFGRRFRLVRQPPHPLDRGELREPGGQGVAVAVLNVPPGTEVLLGRPSGRWTVLGRLSAPDGRPVVGLENASGKRTTVEGLTPCRLASAPRQGGV